MEQPETVRQYLDQLQTNLNAVLEQTGRVFAATAKGSKENRTVQAMKLKQMYPGANANFQDALDELEYELEVAKAVMRRDLAVLRGNKSSTTAASQDASGEGAQIANTTTGITNAQPADTDITMEEAPPAAKTETATADMKPDSSPVELEQQASDAMKSEEQAAPDQKPQSPLKLDTSTGPAASQDGASAQDLDTANFDDLFGDPASATSENKQSEFPFDLPSAGPEDTAKPTGSDKDDAMPDFNFTSFNESLANETENENTDMHGGDDTISSLLPGLESYANAADNGDMPDFDFGTSDVGVQGNENQGQSQDQDQNNQGQPAGGEGERDTTFDDLMNDDYFNFGDFGTAEGEGENGGVNYDEDLFKF